STRQPLSDPRLSSRTLPETFSGSDTITHLHIFFCERGPFRSFAERSHGEILRRRFPGGCSRSPGDRRRARRDVRLRASSLAWTPRAETSSRRLPHKSQFSEETEIFGPRNNK